MARGQSDIMLWFEYRKHAITATKAHDVMTRYVTVQRSNVFGCRQRIL